MTSSCSSQQLRPARRGRQLSQAFILLAGLVLSVTSAVGVRAQEPTPTPSPTPAPSSADLTVSKSGDEAAAVGGLITYNISVFNGGPDNATNVVLSDPLPAHTTFVSASVTTGDGTVSFDGTTVDVHFDSILAFESGGATIVVSVNADTPRGTTVSNTVLGRSDAADPQTFDNTATALTVITGPFPGDILISEFRLRGPAGAADEYIEIYNNAATPHLVQSPDGSAGYSVAASDGVIRCTIPNGTILPARAHFLCVNSVGYSLSSYPAGDASTAEGDLNYTTDIPDNAGIAVFRTSNTENFNLTNRFDAVGSTSETNALYKEGTGYPALSPLGLDYALYRDTCGKAGSAAVVGPCPTGGVPKDTDNNAVDFVFVSPDGNSSGAGARLGAPGPEDSSSPIQSNASFAVNLLDPCASSSSPPNRVRSFTSDPANNSTFGTLDIRRTVTNGTGQNVTRLRWRIIDISTLPAPRGVADLRALTSTPIVATVDRAPCNTEASVITVQGTTLEQPPAQVSGGGFNSSLSSDTITLKTPLADGESIDVRFLLGIMQTGTFKFFINVEAITRDPEIVPESGPEKPSVGSPIGPSVRPGKVTAMTSSTSSGVSAPTVKARKSVKAPPAKASKGGRR